jgi:DedD protein
VAETTPRPQDPIPKLTFYQELTAPLTSPPPPAKARPEPPRPRAEAARPAESSERAEARAPAPASSPSHPVPPPAAAPAESRGPFTVQVGAYRARGQADAMRDRLRGKGIEAYVSEAATAAGTRYRVRVGSYGTREAAQAAAVRLAADTQLGAYVAPR